MGISTNPITIGKTVVEDAIVVSAFSCSWYGGGNPFIGLFSHLGTDMLIASIVEGKLMRRIKGALKKVLAFAKGKVWPIVRPLVSVVASVLPGPASLVA